MIYITLTSGRTCTSKRSRTADTRRLHRIIITVYRRKSSTIIITNVVLSPLGQLFRPDLLATAPPPPPPRGSNRFTLIWYYNIYIIVLKSGGGEFRQIRESGGGVGEKRNETITSEQTSPNEKILRKTI